MGRRGQEEASICRSGEEQLIEGKQQIEAAIIRLRIGPQGLKQSITHCRETFNMIMEDCREPETTEHALLVCKQYTGKRRVMMDGLGTLGIGEGVEKSISEYVDSERGGKRSVNF